MANKERQMIRVNTRISTTANEWLDNYSMHTGLPKSTIIMMAIEGYIQQSDVMDGMKDMGQLFEKMEELERKIESNKDAAK